MGQQKPVYTDSMTKLAEEAARIVDRLPQEKAEALLDYARYLEERADEEAWQARFASPRHREKLTALMETVEREIAPGLDQPLDLERRPSWPL
jgi:hypothetical protein